MVLLLLKKFLGAEIAECFVVIRQGDITESFVVITSILNKSYNPLEKHLAANSAAQPKAGWKTT